MTIDIISAILFPVQIRKTGKRIAGVLALAAAAAVYAGPGKPGCVSLCGRERL